MPMLIPSPETQASFNNATKKSFTHSFNFWTTDRRVIDTEVEYQLDIGSAHKINSPKFIFAAHQTSDTDRAAAPNKAINTAIYDHFDVIKYLVDGISYPRDSVIEDCNTNNYLDQNRYLKLFFFMRNTIAKPY